MSWELDFAELTFEKLLRDLGWKPEIDVAIGEIVKYYKKNFIW